MQRWFPAVLMIVILTGFRLLGSSFPEVLPNLQPLVALLLCGVIFLNGPQRWLVPLVAWGVTDPPTSLLQDSSVLGWHHLAILLGLGATAGIALWIRRSPTWLSVMGGAILSALAFYFITNLVSFIVDPLYAKSLTGFVQAQWTGPVGYGPTWPFLRNLLAANLLFTALFCLARRNIGYSVVESPRAIAR